MTPYGDGTRPAQKHSARYGCPPAVDGRRPEHKCRAPWFVRLEAGWTERRTRRRIEVQGATKKLAERRANEKRQELAKARGVAINRAAMRITVRGWFDEWTPLRVTQVAPNTHTTDLSMIRLYVLPTIGDKRLVDLGVRDIRAVADRARAKGRASATVLRVRRTLVGMLRDALSEGYHVPEAIFNAKAGRAAKGATRPKRTALPLPQAIAVLAEASDRPGGVRWLIGFYLGLRQGEVLGLRWEDIDFETGWIHVRRQLQPIPYADPKDRSKGFRIPDDYDALHLVGRFHLVELKTERSERRHPLVPALRAALLAWRDAWPENPHRLLFARADGWPIDDSDDRDEFKAIQRAAEVAKPDGSLYTVHEMRNTAATILIAAGIDPVTVTAILGHSSFATSLGYAAAQQEQMAAALGQVAASYVAAPPALSVADSPDPDGLTE